MFIKNNSKCLMRITIVVIIILFFIDFWCICLLKRHGAISRIVVIDNIDDYTVGNKTPLGTPFEQKNLFKQINLENFNVKSDEEKVIAILQWIMNQVKKVEPEESNSPYKILINAQKENKGALCSGMARIFFESLTVSGLPARLILLNRNIFDNYDSHVTVEVFINGKWRIYDPTFNVSFKNSNNDDKLSAQEISKLLVSGKSNEIIPVFYGNVAYPPRLENFYINYYSVCNNVFVIQNVPKHFFYKLPIFHYLKGTVLAYQKNGMDWHIKFIRLCR